MNLEKKTIMIAGAAALVVLAFLTACKKRGAEADAGGLRGAVLILIDTMRADHLACYGYGRATSPRLDRLAGEGVLFEQTVSFSPWTLPSVVNILSGCNPAPPVFEEQRLKRSLVEDISRAGFLTGAVTEGGFVSKFFNIHRGFVYYHEEEGPVQLHIPGKPLDMNPTGGIERTFRLAREWIGKHGDKRFFLLIHTYEPHTPYTRRTFTEGMTIPSFGETFTIDTIARIEAGDAAVGEGDLEYLAALYDGGILESDRHVGEFLDFLEEAGLDDEVLVAVTSDHGEDLGDHYISRCGRHGHSCLDDLVMVPLIVRNPREDYPVKRVKQQVRLMDVMPTVADILGIPAERAVRGASLVPLMRGEDDGARPASGGAVRTGPNRMFLRWLGYKFIRVIGPEPPGERLEPPPPPMQLYDLRADPGERTNLAKKEPDIVRKMMNILSRTENPEAGDYFLPDDLDDTLRRRLESLGY